MVKFQKQLEGQLVHEWKDAYLNYKQLKKDLHQIKEKQINQHENNQESSIKVMYHVKSKACDVQEDVYETILLESRLDSELDKIFFARLDAQLNMINKFYKCKEEEYILWENQLRSQMSSFLKTHSSIYYQTMNKVSSKVDNNDTFQKGKFMEKTKTNDRKWCDGNICKRNLQHASKMWPGEFIEFYKGLKLLRKFSSLNTAAFGKILKKYDKITGQCARSTYLRVVECSHFASSNKVSKLIDKAELVFIEHFTKDNPSKVMTYVRPIHKSPTHVKTFFLGIFSGCSISLLMIFFILIIVEHTVESSKSPYIQYSFPICSTLSLFLLHMYMYACNLYLWKRVGINHVFIFEITPGTELSFYDIMLLNMGLTTLLLGGMIIPLIFLTNVIKAPIYMGSDIIMLPIFMTFLALLVLPFKICYRSTRLAFLRCLGHTICSPFYKVTFSDFFLADQLTSQVTTLRNLGYASCYYIGGYFRTHDINACTKSLLFNDFLYIISVLPYWWRLMQCLRRWIDERDKSHIANGGKYLSALLAVLMRITFERNDSLQWLTLFILSSILATLYQTYWDIVIDWGLFQQNIPNPWLREKLILKQKFIYFICMGINTILRLPWLHSLLHLQIITSSQQVIDFIFACLEVIRRGLWNFIRLENEHLNNGDKHKEVQDISLPFKDLEISIF
eukprot:c17923_g1_i1 orf=111-2138(-)